MAFWQGVITLHVKDYVLSFSYTPLAKNILPDFIFVFYITKQ